MLALWPVSLPIVEASASLLANSQTGGSNWPWILISALVVIAIAVFAYGFYCQQKSLKLLTKECRRVNTVAMGMGQHILAIEKHIIGLGQDAQAQHDQIVSKARELLKTGASVDDVTQYSGLSHAEVSLISTLNQSNSSSNVHALTLNKN